MERLEISANVQAWNFDLQEDWDILSTPYIPSNPNFEKASEEMGEISWHGTHTYQDALKAFLSRKNTLRSRLAARVDTYRNILQGDIPTPQTIRRQRQWNRQGNTVSVSRILAGNSKPWRKSVRQGVTGPQTITVLWPVGMNAGIEETEYAWSVTISLLLCEQLANAGYSLDIWTVNHTSKLFPVGPENNIIALHVLAAGDTWDIEDMLSLGTLWGHRRLGFRLKEACQEVVGHNCEGYGFSWRSVYCHYDLQSWYSAMGMTGPYIVLPNVAEVYNESTARVAYSARLEQIGENHE